MTRAWLLMTPWNAAFGFGAGLVFARWPCPMPASVQACLDEDARLGRAARCRPTIHCPYLQRPEHHLHRTPC
ncbi:MAG: hypothetical protein EBT36_06555 [Betaproteobacteria bacterium]|nr:hypothetical protein [Betaproteobacteria bacterium]